MQSGNHMAYVTSGPVILDPILNMVIKLGNISKRMVGHMANI